MHPSQIPEKPLTAAVGNVETAQRIYFFETEDGRIIHAQGREAWNLYKNRNQIIGRERPRNKLIGVSDGTLFRQGILEAQKIMREKGLEASQARVRLAVEEELAVARTNKKIPPQNYDTITTGGVPVNLDTFGKQ